CDERAPKRHNCRFRTPHYAVPVRLGRMRPLLAVCETALERNNCVLSHPIVTFVSFYGGIPLAEPARRNGCLPCLGRVCCLFKCQSTSRCAPTTWTMSCVQSQYAAYDEVADGHISVLAPHSRQKSDTALLAWYRSALMAAQFLRTKSLDA